MNIHLGIPEVLMILCYLIVLIGEIKNNGKPKNQKYSAGNAIVGTVIGIALLAWGGFF